MDAGCSICFTTQSRNGFMKPRVKKNFIKLKVQHISHSDGKK